MQDGSKPERMASVPMTVIGLPLLSRAGKMASASPVMWKMGFIVSDLGLVIAEVGLGC
jgi:hypothetical protein